AVMFGIVNRADFSAADIDTRSLGRIRFRLLTPNGEARAELSISGQHNLSNALAASAVGVAFGLSAEEIASALSTARPPKMRGEIVDFAAGFTAVGDTFKPNPPPVVY